MSKRRLLGIFAHPDDEVFCAGGTLAKYAAAGAETLVVSATRGEAGQIRDARAATRRTLGQVREQELRQACERLGVRNVECLDYGDGTLGNWSRRELADVFTEIIRSYAPDTVITFGPDGAYGHPDHIAVSEAVTEACRSATDTRIGDGPSSARVGDGTLSLYHSHFLPRRLLLLENLSEWLMGLKSAFRGTADFIHALSVFARETTALKYAGDFVDVSWHPPGSYILEQGEPATSLHLILSGRAQVVQEAPDGAMTVLAELAEGEFFGEIGVAKRQPRLAHVVALENVTCLVLSPSEPTLFAGRGEDAAYTTAAQELAGDASEGLPTTCIDVSEHVYQKVAAIAAYRTQYPIDPDMFPPEMLRNMFGHEYFVRVLPPTQMETELR